MAFHRGFHLARCIHFRIKLPHILICHKKSFFLLLYLMKISTLFAHTWKELFDINRANCSRDKKELSVAQSLCLHLIEPYKLRWFFIFTERKKSFATLSFRSTKLLRKEQCKFTQQSGYLMHLTFYSTTTHRSSIIDKSGFARNVFELYNFNVVNESFTLKIV